MITVNPINIKNKKFIELLDSFKLFQNIPEEKINKFFSNQDSQKLFTDYYVSHDFAKKIVDLKDAHMGLPEHAYAFNLTSEPYYVKCANTLLNELSAFNNAVFLYYPPKGYLSWHNNADAPGYNIILTWSETGDGYFEYINSENEFVKIKDKVGWSAKFCYFGDHLNSDKVVYHCAYTNSPRITIAFRFNEIGLIWKDIIDELESE